MWAWNRAWMQRQGVDPIARSVTSPPNEHAVCRSAERQTGQALAAVAWGVEAARARAAIGAALLFGAAVAMAQSPNAELAPAALPAAIAPLSAMVASVPSALPAPPSLADTPDAVARRWQESFDAFAAADRAHPPTPGGVLFVGSSSIRLWNGLETEFSHWPVVVKRGFGGSSMSDCTAELRRLVVPYRPRMVVIYAGDNDLAAGRTPQQVLKSFRGFVEGVRRALPQTRIAYLSIKPSPLREALLPAIRATNAMIASYTASAANLDYIDVYTPMLGADGRPRAELFRADRLHLNAVGYALWKTVVAAHLQ